MRSFLVLGAVAFIVAAGAGPQRSTARPAQDASQSSSQSSSQTGAQSPAPAEDSVAEAARKAKAKKAKPEKDDAAKDKTKKGKVYSEEDLKGMSGGLSVVGDASGSGEARNSSPVGGSDEAANQKQQAEQEWRGRAKQIHDEMDATDQQIKDLKADIQKNGASGFDPQTGLKQNVIYINDKNAHLQQLEARRKKLEQQLDELQEAARKANIPSEWVR
jgi:hypothetical protein